MLQEAWTRPYLSSLLWRWLRFNRFYSIIFIIVRIMIIIIIVRITMMLMMTVMMFLHWIAKLLLFKKWMFVLVFDENLSCGMRIWLLRRFLTDDLHAAINCPPHVSPRLENCSEWKTRLPLLDLKPLHNLFHILLLQSKENSCNPKFIFQNKCFSSNVWDLSKIQKILFSMLFYKM